MQDANNGEQSDDDSDSYRKCQNKFNKCETLDEGTFAFMHWLNSEDKRSLSSTDNPIVLLKFINDKHTILYDTNLHEEVDVEINEGIPYCKYCKEDDCAHVGFAIEIEQLFGHSRSGKEETIEDIII
ncbi:MAG TPA: hypothetical protein VEL11_18250 [Candidatus Bathyarchaeia archaeon]|nr:hypothetical protein [Candidatus Bathyarchaeia archaeon]